MNTQYRKKIRVITLHESFFELFSDGSDPEMLLIKEEMHRRPCLVLVKIKYKEKKFTVAIPFRSNIHRSCPKIHFSHYHLEQRQNQGIIMDYIK